jgi:hypothetical protein
VPELELGVLGPVEEVLEKPDVLRVVLDNEDRDGWGTDAAVRPEGTIVERQRNCR